LSAPTPLTADDLFRIAFLPLYPEDAKSDLARARSVDANPANNPRVLAHLAEAADIFAQLGPTALGETKLELDASDASVHHLSQAVTKETRDRWLAEPNCGTAEGTLFNFVIHGSAYVGACVLRSRGDAARWLVRRPLWESLVGLRSPVGESQLAVFHWWLKALSDDALEGRAATLADRYRSHVEVPTADVEALPVFVRTERTIPRLKKARYDALYKLLRAHVPELRDVGRDFPSPERFAEMNFRWLDAHVLGGGRMVLLAGPGEGGVFLIWLDASGFVKSAFVAADEFPDPLIEVRDDRITVLARHDGKEVVRDMLWWGP
jgi:hypothetical protein